MQIIDLQAEAAAAAGESSFRSFMIAVQRSASSVAILQQVIISLWCLLLMYISCRLALDNDTSAVFFKYHCSALASCGWCSCNFMRRDGHSCV